MSKRSISLCSGIGGLDIAAANVFGVEPTAVADNDPHASKVLDHHYPGVRNFGDLTDLRNTPISRPYLITAGFPCQNISAAGKGEGITGSKSSVWFDCLRVISYNLPPFVLIENVARLKTRGLDAVLAGLTWDGYGGLWCFYRSGYFTKNPSGFAHVGAPHQRKRLFILAERGRRGFTEYKPPAFHPPEEVSKLLPSATASMSTGAWSKGREGGLNLQTAISRLTPTPIEPRLWGEYAPAIARWEPIIGRPAPPPVDDQGRLNPALPEWMLGYPQGWVTDLDLPRTQQLKRLGNSVQPQVAQAAASAMLEEMNR